MNFLKSALFFVGGVILLIGCTGGSRTQGSVEYFKERDGIIAVEAEDYHSQSDTLARKWYVVGSGDGNQITPDPDSTHEITASGESYLEILPDTRATHDDQLIHSENFSNEPGKLAILTYNVWFDNPGKYYVWVRAFSTGTEDNGIHVGIDGTWPESGQRMQWCDGKNQWTWESKQRTQEVHCGEPGLIYLNVESKGAHTISFSMREDGFEFDKWVMEKEYNKPVGTGPESN
jgi:hypothetical protein